MAIHFITILGTSNYEPVSYDGEDVTPFVQIALLKKFHKDLSEPDSRISIFVTQGAKKQNCGCRPYSDREIELSGKWPSGVRPKSGDEKEGLDVLLKKEESLVDLQDKIEFIDIPEGKSEAEIWEIFKALYDSIDPKDRIIFDITHSFRSIPMLAITVLNYAKVTKECRLQGIYYGAYEAAGETRTEDGFKQCPVFNLTLYNEILEWSNAADMLIHDGNPKAMSDILQHKISKEKSVTHQASALDPLKKYVDSMSVLAQDLETCRGASAATVKEKPGRQDKEISRKSIQAAASVVHAQREQLAATNSMIEPLQELLNKAEESYAVFDKEENYELGLAAVQWYIDKDMTQQGLTALEETAKTYLCKYYSLNQSERASRDGIAGRAINDIAYMKDYSEKGRRIQLLKELENIKKDKFNDTEKKYMLDHYPEVFIDLPYEYADLVRQIKDCRNDINHFGMRKSALPSDKIHKQFENLYKALIKSIGLMEAARTRK